MPSLSTAHPSHSIFNFVLDVLHPPFSHTFFSHSLEPMDWTFSSSLSVHSSPTYFPLPLVSFLRHLLARKMSRNYPPTIPTQHEADGLDLFALSVRVAETHWEGFLALGTGKQLDFSSLFCADQRCIYRNAPFYRYHEAPGSLHPPSRLSVCSDAEYQCVGGSQDFSVRFLNFSAL